MKKTGVLCGVAVCLLLAIQFASSTVTLNVESWKADNLSGYACSDLDGKLILTALFYGEDNTYENIIIQIDPSSEQNTPCNNNNYFPFYINIFNQEELSEILDKFPLSTTIVEASINNEKSTITGNLDFSCKNQDQTILKLYKPKNGHIYSWDTSVQNNGKDLYPICYERIFGYEFEDLSGSVFHPASCTSPVLWKATGENTHASKSEISGKYATPVCYGDLECSSKTEDCDDISGEKLALKLYQDSNSHASDPSDENYIINICCKTKYSPNPIESVSWKNMYNEDITEANKTDYVKAYLAAKAGASIDQKQINFEIFNSNNPIFSNEKTASSDHALTLWEAVFLLEQTPLQYIFKAFLKDNPLANMESNNLEIKDKCSDDEFKIKFISPKCGKDFKIGDKIQFEINITSPNRYILGNISLGDNSDLIYFNNSESNIISFKYTYATSGTKKIIAKATSVPISEADCPERIPMTRKKMINLIIVDPNKDETFTAACIDTPEEADHIDTQKVSCTAESSRILVYTSNSKSYDFKNFHLAKFTWTFSDNTKHEFIGVSNLQCNDNYDTQHIYTNPIGETYTHTISCESATNESSFTKYFQTAGDHEVDLSVVYPIP